MIAMTKGTTMQEKPAPTRANAARCLRRAHAVSSSVSGRVPLRAFPSHHRAFNSVIPPQRTWEKDDRKFAILCPTRSSGRVPLAMGMLGRRVVLLAGLSLCAHLACGAAHGKREERDLTELLSA